VSLRVEGLQSLVRDLLALGLDVEDLKDAFSDIAKSTAAAAARYAPKGATGRLAGSVRGNRARSKAVIAAGGKTSAPYAGPINYGWRARRIQPAGFMQKADAFMKPYATRVLTDNINRKIRQRGLG